MDKLLEGNDQMTKVDGAMFRIEKSLRAEINALRVELNDMQGQISAARKVALDDADLRKEVADLRAQVATLDAKVAECTKALKLIVAMPAIQMHLMSQGHRPNVGVTLSPAEHQAPVVEHKNRTLASVQAGLGSLAANAKRS
jgi:hypothetical protein